MADNATRVVIADDHWVVTQGLADYARSRGIEVTATCASADELVAHCQHTPDSDEVVVLDLSLDEHGGEDTLRRVREVRPDARVLVLSMRESIGVIRYMYERGVDGYVTKTCSPDQTVQAIETVAAGTTYYMPGIAEQILEAERRGEAINPRRVLDERELEILRQVALGADNETIAADHEITEKRVRSIIREIRHKIGAAAIAELGWIARRYGLVALDL